MNKKTVAILGATSHIAKGLIERFAERDDFILYLFTRSSKKMSDFLCEIKKTPSASLIIYEGYNDFSKRQFDLIINCVGIGTLRRHGGCYEKYFTVIEEFDNLALNYLTKNPDTLYISFSSGAIYGSGLATPADDDTIRYLAVNRVKEIDYYGIVRINAEAKHRAFKKFNIVDLRLFAYFSRFIDLDDGYFLTEMINCIKNNKIFSVTADDFMRDFLHPDDLFFSILVAAKKKYINAAYDICSAAPVSKKEILNLAEQKYGLKYRVDQNLNYESATGVKNIYFSLSDKARRELDYTPRFTSLSGIDKELSLILS